VKYKQNKSTKRIDIVLLVPTLDGGIGKVTSILANGMHTIGLQVEVWSIAKNGEYENYIHKDISLQYLGSRRALSSLRPIIKLLNIHKPKVLLSASYHLNVIAILARILTRVPTRVFVAEHKSLAEGFKTISLPARLYARSAIRILYKYADGWVAISKSIAEQIAYYSAVSIEKINIIYNPIISPGLFTKSKEQITHPFLATNEPLILSVGRLSKEKDYITLLKAFAIVRKKIPAKLLILGEGQERNDLEALVNKLGIKNQISMPGFVDNPYPYFRCANLFVLSSVLEGFPIVLIESLALNTPVVSTTAGNPEEIPCSDTCVKIVPTRNPEAMANAIIATLNTKPQDMDGTALSLFYEESSVAKYIKILNLKS